MSRRVQIDQLADAVMRELENYADTTTDGVKGAVKKAANTVKKRDYGRGHRHDPESTQKAGVPRQQRKAPLHWR